MTMAQVLPIPSVSLIAGRPATTSLAIADHFGKPHDRVLKDIRNLCGNCPESFSAVNFDGTEYADEQGKQRPMFTVFFDGFILLAMGYTGKRALQIKLAYIEAFNAMEAALRAPASLPLSPFPRVRTLSKSRRQELNDLVLAKLAHVPPAFVWKTRMAIWTAFNSHFSIPRYNLLPEARMGEALAFLSELEVGPNGLVSRRTPQLPLPVDDARRTASALSALIEQARDVLAALPAVREVEA